MAEALNILTALFIYKSNLSFTIWKQPAELHKIHSVDTQTQVRYQAINLVLL